MQTMQAPETTRVVYGVNELELDLAGKTVHGIWKALEQVFNIPSDAQVRVNGARVDDEHGAPPQRERGPEYVVVLVSDAFDGVPWLERVYQAGSLWDSLEMGAPADIHCYTPAEFGRKRNSMPAVREAAEHGVDLLEESRS